MAPFPPSVPLWNFRTPTALHIEVKKRRRRKCLGFPLSSFKEPREEPREEPGEEPREEPREPGGTVGGKTSHTFSVRDQRGLPGLADGVVP